MNNKVLNVVCFAAGAVTGWFVACQMLRKAFAEQAQDEINEMRDFYMQKLEELEAPLSEEETAEVIASNPNKPSIKEYAAARLQELRNEIEEDEEDMNGPQVISPDEFGDYDEYYQDTLHYYNNGVVTRAFDPTDTEPFTDQEIDDCIGHESLTTFGQYEEDTVFVRNDEQKCYYEILRVDEDYCEESSIPND